MAGKSGSSKRWLQEHFSDAYVKQAQREGYRARAVYKLIELNERDRLFRAGNTLIDLGAAPGSWSQYLGKIIGKGQVIALDILAMPPLAGVEFIQGDFTSDSVFQLLLTRLADKKVDWVLSDMAPDMSGIESVDQPRAMELAELALDFAIKVLRPDGGFVVKVFQGEGFDAYLRAVRQQFAKVVIRKPKASRDRSREVYLVARQLR